MIPIINKPTKASKKTATAICFVDTNFKSAIFKSDISDNFLICGFYHQ